MVFYKRTGSNRHPKRSPWVSFLREVPPPTCAIYYTQKRAEDKLLHRPSHSELYLLIHGPPKRPPGTKRDHVQGRRAPPFAAGSWHFTCVLSNPHEQPCKRNTVILIIQMRKLRTAELKWLPQGRSRLVNGRALSDPTLPFPTTPSPLPALFPVPGSSTGPPTW